ncbi:MAG TPA: glycogen-binding domain-containing protein, partial [Gemmatimonadales bacterium]|nr:glycogen-binding domain-containing protein [Gemmatimonadales bacterium]
LELLRGVELLGSAETYPSNRLTEVPGGRTFTVGISLGIGGPHAPKPLPSPAGIPGVRPGLTRLSLSAPRASRVEVAGDWSDWNSVQLSRTTNGVWYVDLAIPAGVYRYAFRVDGKSWEVPKGVAAVNDGFGGKSAWLSVRGSGQTATQSANRKEAP